MLLPTISVTESFECTSNAFVLAISPGRSNLPLKRISTLNIIEYELNRIASLGK